MAPITSIQCAAPLGHSARLCSPNTHTMPGLMVSIAHDIIEPNANQPLEDFRKESGEIMKLT